MSPDLTHDPQRTGGRDHERHIDQRPRRARHGEVGRHRGRDPRDARHGRQRHGAVDRRRSRPQGARPRWRRRLPRGPRGSPTARSDGRWRGGRCGRRQVRQAQDIDDAGFGQPDTFGGGFGKWHLTPDNVQGAAGPFDHWPQSWAFDHWWGFLSGAAGQYDPILTQDNTIVGIPEGTDGKPYYFLDDITDKSVEWLHAVRAQDATKPWMMYYSTGCAHPPHHVSKEGAAEHPEKVKELVDLFWQDAERNRVLPHLGGFSIFFGILPPLPTITRFTFAGDVQNVQRGMVPRIQGRSYAIEAQLTVPESGAEGVIVANADFIGGFGLWVDEQRRLNHTYSFLGVETYRQVPTEPIPTGDVTVRMLFEADAPKPGTGGNVTLWANDRQIGEGRIEHTVAAAFSSYGGMDLSRDNGLVAGCMRTRPRTFFPAQSGTSSST